MASARIDKHRRVPHVALAAANGGLLPADILHEILLRLPANVLCRLRLVCRSWRSLTSDPIFARAHLSHHPLVIGICHVAGDIPEVQFVDMSGDIVKRIPIMERDWDGYIVNAKASVHYTGRSAKNTACVLNPRTGVFTVLRADIAAVHESRSSPILSLSLMGHIPSTGEYKVLRIHRYLHRFEPDQTCEIMAIGNDGGAGRWTARASPPMFVQATPLHGVVVDGIVYFLVEAFRFDPSFGEIASFDLATEEWKPSTLQGPLHGLLPFDDEENRLKCLQLTKLNGCLVTICRYYNAQDNYTDDWIDLWFSVDMDKGLWTKRYTLRYIPRLRRGFTFPLEVLNDGMIFLWDDGGKCIRVYDPKTNISTHVAELINFSGVCIYQGSLLCSDPSIES